MPYSPKCTLVPPLAMPLRFGRCCLRCLTLRGISMSACLPLLCGLRGLGGGGLGGRLGGPGLALATAPARTLTARAALVPAPGPGAGRGGLTLGAGGRGVALVDPHLHADPAEGGAGLVEAVVDVGAQRVRRHPALAVELRARHLGAAETARALHPDALRAALHRGLHRLPHGAAERDTAGQLLGHPLGDELRVDLGVLHLEDVELDLLAGQLLEVATDTVRLGAPTPD